MGRRIDGDESDVDSRVGGGRGKKAVIRACILYECCIAISGPPFWCCVALRLQGAVAWRGRLDWVARLGGLGWDILLNGAYSGRGLPCVCQGSYLYDFAQ